MGWTGHPMTDRLNIIDHLKRHGGAFKLFRNQGGMSMLHPTSFARRDEMVELSA